MKKHIFTGGLIASAYLAMANAAAAQSTTVGDAFDSLEKQAVNAIGFVTVLAFALGVVLAIMGFLKFKANAQNPNDPSNKISTAFMLVFVGAGLVSLPAVLKVGAGTFLGGGQTTSSQGFTSIN